MSNAFDTSSYQNGIPISRMNAAFILPKADEGTNYISPDFARQARQTIQSGKDLLPYHFAGGANYQDEANHMLRVVKPFEKHISCLPLDYEGAVVNAYGPNWAYKYLKYVYNQTGLTPMIYMGLSDENRFNWSSVSKIAELWVAQYNNFQAVYGYHPRSIYGHVRNWRKVAIFQYTSTGILPGWNGYLDLDSGSAPKGKGTKTGDNKEMTWSIAVEPTDIGGFMVTKHSGATLWTGPNNDHKTRKTKLKYSSNWRVTKEQDGFFRLGTNQWVDGRTGVYKPNPINPKTGNPNMHCIIKIIGPAKYHNHVHDNGYGHEIKKGKLIQSFKYNAKENYFYVKTKSGKTVSVNGKKVKVVLG